jgi:hypothetical protein
VIRFTWLQFRLEAATAFGALAIVAIALAITGPHLVHLYDTTIATCGAHGNCSAARAAILRNDSSLRMWLGLLVVVAPAVVGIFWGAPLVAGELEAGTFRLAWTQSVTRTRWMAVKLGVLGLASMAVTALLTLMVTWWASPLDRANMSRFSTFDRRDIVPIAYAAFAFALGVTAGILIGRTVPAIFTTLVAFVAVRLATTSWIRPLLIAPLHRAVALDPGSTGFGSSASGLTGLAVLVLGDRRASTLQPAPPNIPNAWITSTRIVDRSGHSLTTRVLDLDCPNLDGGAPGGSGGSSHAHASASAQHALHDCVARVGATYHELVSYQPAGRYWAFQSYELAIYMGAAALLAGFCVWLVRRRPA